MAKEKIFNYAIAVAFIMTVFSGSYYLYEHNFMNLKQEQLQKEHVRYMKDKVLTSNDEISYEKVMKECLKQDRKDLVRIGTLSIPELEINVPIYNKPYDEEALEFGAQRMASIKDGKLLGNVDSNNLVLVGHNYGDGRRMFSPLQEGVNQDDSYFENGSATENKWLKGKQAYVATKNGISVYTIDYQKAVRESDTTARKETRNKVLTLITCLEPDDDHRIVTRANLSMSCAWNTASPQILKYLR